ncbi:Hsp20/alpha crystallin family protein [Leptothermofonsia sichuanensis E412]|uniref:Hsp20/alpha crystallin family protein n=1 Tax=Leptothermofonsia sichuanensis TaxID=2917832 RepID=UPI001CA78BE4|nr:Hsp20/alpha crystallin family protein [Leptothermofonsia sichuanensis]QZZ18746.1 Hsp20/alpha crystallin family protein [Leptothermofonsia sichuanensis E412]
MRYRRFSYRYTGIFAGMMAPSQSNVGEGQFQSSFAYPQWQPAADLYETPTALIVKVEVAGMAEEDFEISLYENVLVIQGVRPWENLEGEGLYHAVNIHYGAFRLEVPLQQPIERDRLRRAIGDRIQTRYDRGFLYVILPKTEVP